MLSFQRLICLRCRMVDQNFDGQNLVSRSIVSEQSFQNVVGQNIIIVRIFVVDQIQRHRPKRQKRRYTGDYVGMLTLKRHRQRRTAEALSVRTSLPSEITSSARCNIFHTRLGSENVGGQTEAVRRSSVSWSVIIQSLRHRLYAGHKLACRPLECRSLKVTVCERQCCIVGQNVSADAVRIYIVGYATNFIKTLAVRTSAVSYRVVGQTVAVRRSSVSCSSSYRAYVIGYMHIYWHFIPHGCHSNLRFDINKWRATTLPKLRKVGKYEDFNQHGCHHSNRIRHVIWHKHSNKSLVVSAVNFFTFKQNGALV